MARRPQERWTPLTLSEIKAPPKEVVLDAVFEIKVDLTAHNLVEFDDIRLEIEQGPTFRRYYRRTWGYDTLLKERGILHLHLGHSGSDKLMCLMQFLDHVLIRQVDTHIPKEDRPVGTGFLLLASSASSAGCARRASVAAASRRCRSACRRRHPDPLLA